MFYCKQAVQVVTVSMLLSVLIDLYDNNLISLHITRYDNLCMWRKSTFVCSSMADAEMRGNMHLTLYNDCLMSPRCSHYSYM